MVVSYERTGRTRQKARTRAALVEATRGLLADGVNPTVEAAADRAGVSRATAYRYFANQRALLVAAHPEVEAPSLLPPDAPDDPIERFESALAVMTGILVEHEGEYRAMLRLSLDPGADPRELVLRRGRAIGWLEDALSPLRERLSAEATRRLALAARSACGIEALVWLTDVAGLDRDEALEVMRWSGRALLNEALSEAAR